MKYNKPEIAILGDVAQVVRFSSDKSQPLQQELIAPFGRAVSPAYDLDD